MRRDSLRSRLVDPENRQTLLPTAVGVLLLVAVLVTAIHSWWIGWPDRLWLSLGALAAIVVAILLARRRPPAVLWVGLAAGALVLLVPAFLHGTDGGGLRIVGAYFDDVVATLFLIAVALAVCWLASLPALAWWGRSMVVALGLFAATPVVMGMVERIPFGEVLVGLWTLPYWLQGAFIGAAILLPIALVVALLGLWLEPLRPRAGSRRVAAALAVLFLATSLVCAFEMNARGLVNGLGFLPVAHRSVASASGVPPASGLAASGSADPAVVSASKASTPVEQESGALSWPEIFTQVRDGIGFEPSRSLLRSPDGVRLNGRGNSLEQARLLADRLTTAGEKVRYVEGRLERPQASSLLAASLPAAEGYGYAESVRISRPTEDADLLARLETHYWIQLEQGGQWIDLDPSFAAAEPGDRFAQPGRSWDQLPAELLPSLAVRVDLERLSNPGYPEPLLSWEGSFEQLSNAAVGLVFQARVEAGSGNEESAPSGGLDVFGAFGGGGSEPEGGAGAKSTIYEATLAVADATLAQGSFRLAGGPREATGVDAVGRIDLHIGLRHPDGRRDEVTRPLFEAAGSDSRPPLFQRHSLLLTANRIPRSWFDEKLNKTLAGQDAKAIRQSLERLERDLSEGGDLAELYQEAISIERTLGPESGHLMNLAFASISDELAAQMGQELAVFWFYDQPRILINTFQGNGETLEVLFDLRQDSCTALAYPGQALRVRESFLYGRGILESILEAKVVELLTGQRPLNTAGLMVDAAADGVPIVMFSQLERSQIETLDLPTRARDRVLAALDRGKIVVMPTSDIEYDGAERWGWWEIEPSTREAVGVLDSGLHQATVQRTLIESEGALDEDMAWVIGAIAGATDTQWVLAALILEYGELNKAALQKAKAYLKQIGGYLCSDIKVGKVWEAGVTVAEVKAEIEGCWEEGYSLGVGGSVGGEITILDKGWCEGFQKGFTCASMSILNGYLADL